MKIENSEIREKVSVKSKTFKVRVLGQGFDLKRAYCKLEQGCHIGVFIGHRTR